MSEDICRSYRQNYGLDIVVFRFFNVFGPNQDLTRKNPPLVNYVTREFANGRNPVLHSDGTQARDYVHINDVLRAVEQAIDTDFDDEYTFNLCSGTTINVNEIVDAVRLASTDFTGIEVVRREPHMLWNSYTQLFQGDNALSTERVAKETLKFSLGSTKNFESKFGWVPSKDTASKVTETASQILTKIRK
jgi:nucleoside-diphosphate-sugar epimerase